MFKSKQSDANESEYRRPLLDEEAGGQPIFTTGDDEDEEEGSALETLKTPGGSKTVTFRDEVQVFQPSLKSTTSSRETGKLRFPDIVRVPTKSMGIQNLILTRTIWMTLQFMNFSNIID